jgi:hypothetical protein
MSCRFFARTKKSRIRKKAGEHVPQVIVAANGPLKAGPTRTKGRCEQLV